LNLKLGDYYQIKGRGGLCKRLRVVLGDKFIGLASLISNFIKASVQNDQTRPGIGIIPEMVKVNNTGFQTFALRKRVTPPEKEENDGTFIIGI